MEVRQNRNEYHHVSSVNTLSRKEIKKPVSTGHTCGWTLITKDYFCVSKFTYLLWVRNFRRLLSSETISLNVFKSFMFSNEVQNIMSCKFHDGGSCVREYKPKRRPKIQPQIHAQVPQIAQARALGQIFSFLLPTAS